MFNLKQQMNVVKMIERQEYTKYIHQSGSYHAKEIQASKFIISKAI